jgi:hypothetical protein
MGRQMFLDWVFFRPIKKATVIEAWNGERTSGCLEGYPGGHGMLAFLVRIMSMLDGRLRAPYGVLILHLFYTYLLDRSAAGHVFCITRMADGRDVM